MTQELRKMRIRQVSLVDAGANGRTFALLKRADATAAVRRSARNIHKGVPASLAPSEVANVVAAAMAGVPGDPSITPELRLEAVRKTARAHGVDAAATEQLLGLVAKAIVGQGPAPAPVAKRRPGSPIGLL